MPPVTVNGVAISRKAIAAEVQNFPSRNPGEGWRAATRALVIRELLLQEAARLGIAAEQRSDEDGRTETVEDAVIRALIEQEVRTPVAEEADLRRFYERNLRRFVTAPLYEVEHILFQARRDDEAAYAAARQGAKEVAAILAIEPERFASLAREISACPSGAVGGSLGQIGPGDTTPEFEKALSAARSRRRLLAGRDALWRASDPRGAPDRGPATAVRNGAQRHRHLPRGAGAPASRRGNICRCSSGAPKSPASSSTAPRRRSSSDGDTIMLGALIDSLDDPNVAERLLSALDTPALVQRLDQAAEREGVPVAQVMASTLRHFMETASEDHWVQLIGIMNRAEDPASRRSALSWRKRCRRRQRLRGLRDRRHHLVARFPCAHW